MTLTDEMIEAAAKAIYLKEYAPLGSAARWDRQEVPNDTLIQCRALARAALTAVLPLLKQDWQPIETCILPKPLGVIVAVPSGDGSWIVGEANTHDVDGEHIWYWVGNSPGDYHGGPIIEINHGPPKFWMPLPEPPKTKE